MRHGKPAILHFVLQVYHEQRPALGHNVVNVPNITERIVKLRAGQAVYAVDGDLQCSTQGLCLCRVIQVLRQFAVKQFLSLVVFLVLNIKSCLLDIGEVLRVHRSEQFLSDQAAWVHAGNIQQRHVAPDALLSVDVSAFADFFSAVCADTPVKGITGEYRPSHCVEDRVIEIHLSEHFLRRITIGFYLICDRSHKPVVELALRIPVPPKYNPGG